MNTSNRPILSDAERVRILDDLDQSDARKGSNRRKWPRLEYRLRGVPVKIEYPDGSSAKVLVPTRNISCGGVSVLLTSFLHIGTKITVGLPDLKGSHRACAGKVAFCRFIAGRIHEIGVCFTEVIELNDFCTPETGSTGSDEGRLSETRTPLAGSVVVLSERGVERVLAVGRLRQTGLDAVGVETQGALMDRVRRVGASAVVLDLAMGTDGWESAVGAIMELCPTLPIVGMVFPADPSLVNTALANGMVGTLSAPLAAPDVHDAMIKALQAGRPYVPVEGVAVDASDATDAAAPQMVRFFVSHCLECARKVRSAMETNDHSSARTLCKGLQTTAPGYGFRSVAFAAREALAELNATGSTDESKSKLGALLNVLDRLQADEPAPEPENAGKANKADAMV
ncbi:MAG: PilZ domain-containing protein [Phycisphaerales bacterium]